MIYLIRSLGEKKLLMIELNDITYYYGAGGRPALSGVTATVGSGLYLLAGENGAGKTTLLRVIGGLLRPVRGCCRVDGRDSSAGDPLLQSRMLLLEERMFFPGRTIRKFASIHSPFYPRFSQEKFNANLRAFGLTGNEPLKSLSSGNLKKSQLAYVLALGVELLLLDEPGNALDIEGRETMKKMLLETLDEGNTVIVSTHTLGDLENLFDGALMMRDSRLLFAGREDEIAERLTFDYASLPDPVAIFSTALAGRFLNIYPAGPGEETRVDWRALYLALHSDRSSDILSQLKK